MQLKELKEMAAKVLAINSNPNETVSFRLRSGGCPVNRASIPKEEIVRATSEFAYRTTINGDAESGELVVRAVDTGTCDSNGDAIYTTPSGVVFVEHRRAGCPEDFDHCSLVPPTFA